MPRWILASVVVASVIAGCGSGHHAPTTGPTVPEVVGLDAASACQKISSAGLHCATAPTAAKCSSRPRNEVLQVSPKAGRRTGPNTQVLITVSAGACAARVPNVVGLSVDNASQQLGNLGYTVAYRCTVDPSHNGRVDKQSPSADKPAASGSTVSITVGLPHCASSNSP